MDSEDGCRIRGVLVNQRRKDDLDGDPEELSMHEALLQVEVRHTL